MMSRRVILFTDRDHGSEKRATGLFCARFTLLGASGLASRNLPSIAAMQCFEAAARHMSFTRAADELNLTQILHLSTRPDAWHRWFSGQEIITDRSYHGTR